jgi:PrtD family type I secretion system ABC transporter
MFPQRLNRLPKVLPTALDNAMAAVKPALWTAVIFSFFINVLGLTAPLYMMQIYDRVLGSRNLTTLAVLTLIVAILFFVSALLESLRTKLLVRTGVKFDEEINEHAFSAVQRATLNSPSMNHVQALRDTDTVREFFTGAGLISLCDVPWVPIYIVVATGLHPWYGILAVVSCAISAVLAILNDRATRPTLDAATKASIAANNKAVTTFRNAEVLQAMGMVGNLRRQWAISRLEQLATQALASDRAGILMACIKFNRMFMQSFVLGLGAYLAIEREISAGSLIAGSIIVSRCIQPIEMAISNWKGIVSMRSAFSRVQELLRALPPPPPRMKLPTPTGKVTVENIIVRAPGKETVILRGVSFGVPSGAVLGVVGPSAAGKSSLARALVGVWPAVAGSVRIDGAEIGHFDPEQLGRFLGYLPQDVELFAGTIAENIARFGEVDEAKIVEAAKMAGVHDMIQRLPGGYDTQIGDAGAALSGGQRQRIGLARALYGMPALIVLDEPNASLDAAGEQALMEAVQRLKESGRTVVMITHKTNSLSQCDLILVLQDGTVQAFGKRDEVLARILGPRIVAGAAPQPSPVAPATPAAAHG